MTINDPEVVAELRSLYPRYEEALINNDVDTLVSMFWSGAQVMRFGAAENLYGPEELEAFRAAVYNAGLSSFIRDENVNWSEAQNEFRGFEIVR